MTRPNKTAVIFDIDGTLLKSEHIDEKFFVMALRDILGEVILKERWSHYTNVTDNGIIAEILEHNGKPCTREIIDMVRHRFTSYLVSHFRDGGSCTPVDGAPEFFRHLHSHDGYAVGIATGGWEKTARMKLAHADFDIGETPLSSSADSDNRTEIMLHCLDRLPGPFSKTVYIGDGLWDRTACEKLGWTFIGIGRKLKGRCERHFDDFLDTDIILEGIG
jgi:phosphoglycolate phosphatase-like HAD superfamily hydrolase